MHEIYHGKKSRTALLFCLEEMIDQENEVRMIEFFVGRLKLADYGFRFDCAEHGRLVHSLSRTVMFLTALIVGPVWYSKTDDKRIEEKVLGLFPTFTTLASGSSLLYYLIRD